MDFLKPDLHLKIRNLQIDQTVTKSGAIIREFSIGQTVIARNYTGSTKWVPDIIRTQLGPLSYEVKPGLVWPNWGITEFQWHKQQPCYPDLRTSNPGWESKGPSIWSQWTAISQQNEGWCSNTKSSGWVQPAVHQIWVGQFLNLFLLDDIRSECGSPQLGWIYELWSDIKSVPISTGMLCLI